MDFLKRHLFFILCGVGGVVGIALGVTGLKAMPRVLGEMKVAEGLYQGLESLPSKPVNEEIIEAEDRRIQLVVDDRNKVIAKAGELYAEYQPLVEGVFPEGTPLKRIAFRTKYHEAMKELLAKLNSGGPASASDVELMRRKIEDEKAEAGRPRSETGAVLDQEMKGAPKNAAGAVTRAGARQDAHIRADIQAAQRIYCYTVGFFDEKANERVSSLEFMAALKDTNTGDPPTAEEVWRAQVGYWIQSHIVNSIADMNNAAAEAAKAAGQDPWVGIMPVKDVISIRLGLDLYVPPKGELFAPPEAVGFLAAVPTGTAETVYTHTASGPYYDVVQVAAKLVMDQRDISRLAERICDNGFYTLVRAAYTEVAPNLNLAGKIYGSEPTVIVVLEFEFVMIGEVFRKWMPKEVCEKFSIMCPQTESP